MCTEYQAKFGFSSQINEQNFILVAYVSHALTTDLTVAWTADDWAELYINGDLIYRIHNWGAAATHNIQPGTQVLAFKIGDNGGGWGFLASLNDEYQSSTANIEDWKCTAYDSTYDGLEWTYAGNF